MGLQKGCLIAITLLCSAERSIRRAGPGNLIECLIDARRFLRVERFKIDRQSARPDPVGVEILQAGAARFLDVVVAGIRCDTEDFVWIVGIRRHIS